MLWYMAIAYLPHRLHIEDAWILGQGRLRLAWTICNLYK